MIVKALGTGFPYVQMKIGDSFEKEDEINFTVIDYRHSPVSRTIWLNKNALKDIYDHIGKLLEK